MDEVTKKTAAEILDELLGPMTEEHKATAAILNQYRETCERPLTPTNRTRREATNRGAQR